MKYRLLGLKSIFCFYWLLCHSNAFAAAQGIQVGGRLWIGNYEHDVSGKIYLKLPKNISPRLNKLHSDKYIFWVEKGTANLFGLKVYERRLKNKAEKESKTLECYRDYWGAGGRIFLNNHWGMGFYGYFDKVGPNTLDLPKNRGLYYNFQKQDDNGNSIEVLLCNPEGSLFNLGVEGFSPYVNTSVNFYASYVTLWGHPKGSLNCKNLYREYSPWAVDLNLWRHFSKVIAQVGVFYRAIDIDTVERDSVHIKRSDTLKGYFLSLEYFLHPVVKAGVKYTWDTRNALRYMVAISFESQSKRLPLYQSVRRYSGPIQYHKNAEDQAILE